MIAQKSIIEYNPQLSLRAKVVLLSNCIRNELILISTVRINDLKKDAETLSFFQAHIAALCAYAQQFLDISTSFEE